MLNRPKAYTRDILASQYHRKSNAEFSGERPPDLDERQRGARVRCNDGLDGSASVSRARPPPSLALAFNWRPNHRSSTIQLSSPRRCARGVVQWHYSLAFSSQLSARRLTPGITRPDTTSQAFKLTDDTRAEPGRVDALVRWRRTKKPPAPGVKYRAPRCHLAGRDARGFYHARPD